MCEAQVCVFQSNMWCGFLCGEWVENGTKCQRNVVCNVYRKYALYVEDILHLSLTWTNNIYFVCRAAYSFLSSKMRIFLLLILHWKSPVEKHRIFPSSSAQEQHKNDKIDKTSFTFTLHYCIRNQIELRLNHYILLFGLMLNMFILTNVLMHSLSFEQTYVN